jgi:hypothetical protein
VLDTDLLRSIATQLMNGNAVEVRGKNLRVGRASTQRLKIVRFTVNGREYAAVEQNPEKLSRWVSLRVRGTKSCSLRMSKATSLSRSRSMES